MERTQDSLSPLEARLARALMPVTAPREFVQRLQGRIRLPEPRQIASRVGDWFFLFIIIGGVLSAMAVLVTLARMLYFFARRRV